MQLIITDAVVIGVDTHKDVHVAVALSGLGVWLGNASAPATADGYRQLAGTIRNFVFGRAVEHQPARALVKRSPKRPAIL